MDTEIEETIKRYRRNKAVRVVIVASLGALTYSKVMGRMGYKMVKPVYQTEAGELIVKNVFGKAFKAGLMK